MADISATRSCTGCQGDDRWSMALLIQPCYCNRNFVLPAGTCYPSLKVKETTFAICEKHDILRSKSSRVTPCRRFLIFSKL